jgi:hypothetical protein
VCTKILPRLKNTKILCTKILPRLKNTKIVCTKLLAALKLGRRPISESGPCFVRHFGRRQKSEIDSIGDPARTERPVVAGIHRALLFDPVFLGPIFWIIFAETYWAKIGVFVSKYCLLLHKIVIVTSAPVIHIVILKIFLPNNVAKKWRFWLKNC